MKVSICMDMALSLTKLISSLLFPLVSKAKGQKDRTKCHSEWYLCMFQIRIHVVLLWRGRLLAKFIPESEINTAYNDAAL